jgi:DNA polymerase-1
MTRSVWSLDLETDLIKPGLLAPPPVCGSISAPGAVPCLLTDNELLPWLQHEIYKSTFVMANGAFDWGAIASYFPELVRAIFKAYDEGRVFDVLIAESLNAIAKGHLFKDPRTGKGLTDPGTGKSKKRYSLSICTDLVLGRKDAKANDWARLRYSLFRGVAIKDWTAHAALLGCPEPEGVAQYPLDDAKNTIDVAVGQRRHENLHQMRDQAYAAWCLHLGSMWGRRTDPIAVANLKASVDARYAKVIAQFKETGLLNAAGEEDQIAKKKRVVLAYGGGGVCPVCGGTGKVISPKSGNPIQCKPCSATGFNIAATPNIKLTDTGGVCADRDTLSESGDDVLEAYANVSAILTLKNRYIPFLELGTKQRINVQANVIVENGRTSYEGLIQLIPRGGGVRECFVAPEGRVYCSTDYPALEMTTLAQVCMWVVGWSQIQQAINAKLDLHCLFAAKLTGRSYEEFDALVKAGDKWAKGIRQACKAGNFGFPGYMGAARFVQSKRAQEGLRICISLGQAPSCETCGGVEGNEDCRRCYGRGFLCGVSKVTEWNNRKISPTCLKCLELTEDLKRNWFAQWAEMEHYFKFIKSQCDNPLGGKLKQFVSGRWRGGLTVPNGANTLFSGLAADLAKRALCLISRECYTSENSPLWDTRPLELIHDEVTSDMPEDRASEAGWEQARLCDVALAEYCPDVKPKNVEPALSYRWFKDAEKVVVDGKLVPWKPKPRKDGKPHMFEAGWTVS